MVLDEPFSRLAVPLGIGMLGEEVTMGTMSSLLREVCSMGSGGGHMVAVDWSVVGWLVDGVIAIGVGIGIRTWKMMLAPMKFPIPNS